jgi:ABC-type multidrug transport system permease subunit
MNRLLPTLMRVLGALALLAIALFCGIRFLVTGHWWFGAAAVLLLLLAALITRRSSTSGLWHGQDVGAIAVFILCLIVLFIFSNRAAFLFFPGAFSGTLVCNPHHPDQCVDASSVAGAKARKKAATQSA